MRKQLLAMVGAAMLGLATAASGPVPAGAIQLAPGLGTAVDHNVIQVQNRARKSVQRRSVQRRSVQRRSVQRRSVQRRNVQRRAIHRVVRRGWSRDRRHIFYGAVLIGVPFGYATYASHYCYDWRVGPQGSGYYWNYYRCPV